MEYKVGKRYKLNGAAFDDIALLENANVFILDSIADSDREGDNLLCFKGVSTSVQQVTHLSTTRAGHAITKELAD